MLSENIKIFRKEKGLSLKTASILMMTVSLVITVVLLFTGIRTFHSFRDMEKSTHNYISMEEAKKRSYVIARSMRWRIVE